MKADLKSKLEEISKKIPNLKQDNAREEQTKISLILPFLEALGYDTSDPSIVKAEINPDPQDNRVGKVDYLIFDKKTTSIICLEAKPVNESLDRHYPQIKRYYNNSHKVKYAILTNGVEYRFYTDSTHTNMLDSEPFFTFQLTELDADLEILLMFERDEYDNETIKSLIEQKNIYQKVYDYIEKQIKEPDDEFVTPICKSIFDGSASRTNKNAIKETLPEVFNQLFDPNDIPKPPKPKPICTKNHHIENKPPNIVNLYDTLKKRILEIEDGIDEKFNKHTIKYIKNNRIFTDLVVQQKHIWIFINLKKGELDDPLKKVEDVSNIGTWGNGDYRIRLEKIADIKYTISLIKQAYLK
ncbi:MAG: DUF5655 domain-containing protein [Flavobacteriaceae bacterium]|nr:DUF5655 domain-containing protein [Flavobacteriaceae bacterium]MCY4215803.1 DUF5655 domain-containing protein [Flavobacteriaceae bacterium]MCY4266803.1 DUF5655 domain-containing protein [Flavobacteriaceae bacterium]